MIGLFISALCVVHVTMHRLTKAHHGPFDRCVDRLPGCPVSPYVSGRGSETDIVFSSVRMLSFILHALQGAGLPVELPTFHEIHETGNTSCHGYPVARKPMPNLTHEKRDFNEYALTYIFVHIGS